MSYLTGTQLEPIISIKNNTNDTINHVLIKYTNGIEHTISINDIAAESVAKTTLNIKGISSPIDLTLLYSHNGILEKHTFFKNFSKKNNIIAFSLEISEEYNGYVCTSSIEHDPIDNSIILSKKCVTPLKKSLFTIALILAAASISYYIYKK